MTSSSDDMIEHVSAAGSANHLVRREAGDPCGGVIPVGDRPLPIDKIDAIIEILYDGFMEISIVGHLCAGCVTIRLAAFAVTIVARS